MKKSLLFVILCLSFTVSTAQELTRDKPLSFPVAGDPGPSTWLFGQAFGNTPTAYNVGWDWYRDGQGLHFGIDLWMPCNTPLLATADGEVTFVDDLSYGSGPHNLIIRHAALGLSSLYGHLIDVAPVVPGQLVRRGQVIGYSGDPDETCISRPHLHYEVRSFDYRTAYDPVDYINMNWHTLALIGGYSYPLFQADLTNARRWLSLDTQPDIIFGGQALNRYSITFPANRIPPNPPLLNTAAPLNRDWGIRSITSGDCCWIQWWDSVDPDRLYMIDGSTEQRAGVYIWSAESGTTGFLAEQAPPLHKSPDGSFSITLNGDTATISSADGSASYNINTNGRLPAISTDNSRVVWSDTTPTVPGEPRRQATIYVANIDGTNVREVISGRGASARWLDANRLLLNLTGDAREATLYVFNTDLMTGYALGTWSWIRNVEIAPGGGRIMFYVTDVYNLTNNAIYAVTTQPNPEVKRMSWFGAWRWRDPDSVYYIPMIASEALHTLHYLNLATDEDIVLVSPETLPFTVMDGNWSVSADGQRIVFRNALNSQVTLLE